MKEWRKTITRKLKPDTRPIFLAIRQSQDAFNGFGAQETTDALFMACIHPCTPTDGICRSEAAWDRLVKAVFDYAAERIKLVEMPTSKSRIPYVSRSGEKPFKFFKDAHTHFLKYVPVFRRKYVKVDSEVFKTLNDLNFLNPDAKLKDDGTACGKCFFKPYL